MKSLFIFITFFAVGAFATEPLDINNLPSGLKMPAAGQTGKGPALADGYSYGMAGQEYQKGYAAVYATNWDGTKSFYDFTKMNTDEIGQFITDYHVDPCFNLTIGHLSFMLESKEPVKTLETVTKLGKEVGCDSAFNWSGFLTDEYSKRFSDKLKVELKKYIQATQTDSRVSGDGVRTAN